MRKEKVTIGDGKDESPTVREWISKHSTFWPLPSPPSPIINEITWDEASAYFKVHRGKEYTASSFRALPQPRYLNRNVPNGKVLDTLD